MRTQFFLGLFATTCCCFGQISSDAFTVTATRNVFLQPDQLVFDVNVTALPSVTLDQIVGMLQSVGITAADLTRAESGAWSFTLPVALSKMEATIAALTALVKSLSNNGMRMTFDVQNAQVSPELKKSQQCAPADLIADAQKQAQRLATASGFSVGPVLAVSDEAIAAVNAAIPTFIIGALSAQPVLVLPPLPVYTPPTITCSLEVKFQLLRYH